MGDRAWREGLSKVGRVCRCVSYAPEKPLLLYSCLSPSCDVTTRSITGQHSDYGGSVFDCLVTPLSISENRLVAQET